MFIHNYGYDPERWFYHGHYARHLLLGVELEVDDGGEDEDKAAEVLRILNGSPYSERNVYIKHDGSLNAGFEIVSQPATINYHIKRIPWKQAFDYLIDNGYRSHDTATCGLHVHFNCVFLGTSEKEFLQAEAKLLAFFEENWEKIVRFSRRKERQIDRYCRRYGHKNIRDAYEENNESRYYVINFQNSTTDEIRIFRGTLRYETFIATLLFVHNLVIYCKKTKHNLNDSWESFLKFVRKFPRNAVLIEYLQKKGLWTL
jgi:hypothetical protein